MMIISGVTILSITLELSIMLLDASFMPLEVSFMTFIALATVATIVNYDNNTFIVQATELNNSY